jgi:indolepyruvate ferredoxin oxidoreductase beta subunit
MGKVTNIIFAGLGGQGVLKASDILAEILFSLDYDVKKSEVHGMSQRGGSVSSEVRFGDEVFSPMIPHGETDYLVIMDPTQVEVNISKLRDGGVLITPADLPLDKLSNPKAANTMFLGALSKYLPEIPEEHFIEVIKRFLPEKVHEVNVEAFKLGRG